MPNIENVKRVRNLIAELPDEQFDYSVILSSEPECGTIGCIAGWCWVLNYEDRYGRRPNAKSVSGAFVHGINMMNEPRNFLGLTTDAADELFIARRFRNDREEFLCPNDITREMALNTLDHLIETGRVDWASANPEV